MAPTNSCPKCGATLPEDAPAGLCPACLMSGGLPSGGNTAPRTGGGGRAIRWEPPSVEELQALLPQYEVIKMLGRGGMGAVYMGRQISVDRPVAIKILSSALEEDDKGFAQRFKNEARAMGKLNHPGIVVVYDFGETAGGLLYIVMEYVEGTDVARMIASQKRLHTAHAMAITAHVCDALAYAHERGIIHRDIKPANIMVGYDGVVKVADFGLAKLSADGQTAGLTLSGMAMGTMHYMAPEALILGASVDKRADIYAVGVMLYQMLTGKLPHGMFELPSLQVAGLDPRYDAIIAKALREDRDIRYQNATEMRLDLDGILTQPVEKVEPEVEEAPAALPTQERPQRPGGKPIRPPQGRKASKKKSETAWVLAGLGVLAALAFIAFFLFKPKNPSRTDSSGGSDLEAATKEHPFVNTLGMKFVPVPIIGGPTDGQRVLFCIHDVRKGDYRKYADADSRVNHDWEHGTEYQFSEADRRGHGMPVSGDEDHPVVNVSWDDAKAYCVWLSRKEGRTYRLPTDHEWSCAVGIGDHEAAEASPRSKGGKIRDVYPWGTAWPPPARAGNFADRTLKEKDPSWDHGIIEGYEDGYATTSPVMSFEPNKLGLYDMSGNVWQWCEDKLSPDDEDKRVLRGGSWTTDGNGALLSANRIPVGGHTMRFNDRGFRIVVSMEKPPETASLGSNPVSPSPSLPVSKSSTSTVTATKDVPDVNTVGQTAAMGGAAITITSSDPIKILKLEAGQPRLYDSNPLRVIEKIAPEMKGWQFTSIPQRHRNSYQISVTKAGVIYAFGEYEGHHPTREQFLGEDASQWEPADGAIEGHFIGACYKRKVMPGEIITLQAFELTLAAGSITISGRYADSAPATSTPSASPTGATKEQPYVNSLGMKFVPVPIIGGPMNGQRVLFSVWDTRVQDYEVFVKATKRDWPKADFEQGPTHPAVMVSWDDAQAFCQWLTSREQATGRLHAEWRYRLPSDHEWSCAVEIGEREDAGALPGEKRQKLANVFPWGTQWPPPKGAGNYAGEEMEPALKAGQFSEIWGPIAGYNDGFVNTSPVCSFVANRFGLYDMGGNVQQWCEDWLDKEQKFRVLRGGSWYSNSPPKTLSSNRTQCGQGVRNYAFGFRVVLSMANQPETASVGKHSASAPQAAPAPVPASRAGGPKKVILVTTTTGFRHASIPYAQKTLLKLAKSSGAFAIVDQCEQPDLPDKPDRSAMDAGIKAALEKLSPENLRAKGIDAVIFANTTGRLPLPDPDGFIKWIEEGHAFVGIHAASDTFHDFPGYIDMLQGEFQTHRNQVPVDLIAADAGHPANAGLGATWDIRQEEVYVIKSQDRAKVHMLWFQRHDPNAKEQAGFFPASWCRMAGKGRVFYTSLGHREDLWSDDPDLPGRVNPVETSRQYQAHILGGIRWALGLAEGSEQPNPDVK